MYLVVAFKGPRDVLRYGMGAGGTYFLLASVLFENAIEEVEEDWALALKSLRHLEGNLII